MTIAPPTPRALLDAAHYLIHPYDPRKGLDGYTSSNLSSVAAWLRAEAARPTLAVSQIAPVFTPRAIP